LPKWESRDAQIAIAASERAPSPRFRGLERKPSGYVPERASWPGFAEDGRFGGEVSKGARIVPAAPIDPFFNINMLDDLARAEEILS
jgi:hypothetical protein